MKINKRVLGDIVWMVKIIYLYVENGFIFDEFYFWYGWLIDLFLGRGIWRCLLFYLYVLSCNVIKIKFYFNCFLMCFCNYNLYMWIFCDFLLL